ncbi:MAG: inositol monophosphatase [Euryarchaeota archaeon]|nr:inositol monophosphatase [Euryarchaeota archaeon]
MSEPTADCAAVAAEAVRASGDYLREAFRNGRVEGDYDSLDVKAVADREAQRRVRSVIEANYPDHAFDGEESDFTTTDYDYRWVVDPLDGTNNFASGLPKFASAVAVLYKRAPVVAAIYEPLVDDLYIAERDGGATLNGEPLRAADGSSLPLAHGTVAFVVGLGAVTDPELAQQAETLEGALGDHCKRVVTTWAPCVDWGLLARGSIEGLVCFHPDGYEHHAGSLLAAESGIEAVDTVAENGRYVGAPDAETAARLAETVDETLSGY